MAKLSDDTLFQRAIPQAIKDRQSLAQCYGNEGEEAQAAIDQATSFQRLRNKKLADLNAAEDNTARLVFVYAEQHEKSVAEIFSGCAKSDSEEARRMLRLFREVRMRRWGQTAIEAFVGNAKAIDARTV